MREKILRNIENSVFEFDYSFWREILKVYDKGFIEQVEEAIEANRWRLDKFEELR